jgi:hypothetical protein
MSENPVVINRGLQEWAERLRFFPGGAAVAATFSEDKISTYAKLEGLGLPHYKSVVSSTEDFLIDPDQFLLSLRTPAYYISVNPADRSLQRHRTYGLDAAKVVQFVNSIVEKEGDRYNSLMLAETSPLYYGGNIIVNPDATNSVYAEMVQGTHSDLVGSHTAIDYKMQRNQHTGRFEYSFDDPLLRQAMYRTLLKVPHEIAEDHGQGFDSRGWKFHLGYYEFALTKMGSDTLQPVFLDYSDKPVFLVN